MPLSILYSTLKYRVDPSPLTIESVDVLLPPEHVPKDWDILELVGGTGHDTVALFISLAVT